MKRIILCLLIFCFNSFAQAQRFEYLYQGVSFSCKLSDNKVCITSFNVNAQRVTIPAYAAYQGVKYPVVKVSTFVNGNNYLTRELQLEEGIEYIDKYSFYEFRKLKNVTLPSTILHIGKNAFRDSKDMAFHMNPDIDESLLRKGRECFITRHILGLSPTEADDSQKIHENNADVGIDEIRLQHELNRQAKEKQQRAQENLKNREYRDQRGLESIIENYDVDSNIPVTPNSNDRTYCVIIANEHYKNAPDVNFAINDGRVFREYCNKTLGIPERNIKFYEDAGYLDLLEAIHYFQNMKYLSADTKFIFYYSGHGIPNEKDRSAYLLPVDGKLGMMQESCISLKALYKNLGEINAKNITVFLDACFSGIQRGSEEPILAEKGFAFRTKIEELTGNVVVLSATSSDQTAQIYGKRQHGLFTYHLLKELKKAQGHITLGKLYESLVKDVAWTSTNELNKLQEPSVSYSATMQEKWKNIYINQ